MIAALDGAAGAAASLLPSNTMSTKANASSCNIAVERHSAQRDFLAGKGIRSCPHGATLYYNSHHESKRLTQRRAVLAPVFATMTGCAISQASEDPQPAPALDKGTATSVSPGKLARVSIMTYNFTSRLKLEDQPPHSNRVLDVFNIADYLGKAGGKRDRRTAYRR